MHAHAHAHAYTRLDSVKMSSSDLKDESWTYVGLNGMLLNITNELPMEESFKVNLLANLYSTVEFLKKDLEEKTM